MILMKHKNMEYLKEIYSQNENGDFILEVFLDRYTDAFNEWDSAFLDVRDLHPGLVYFLERCSKDIPYNKNIELNFMVSENKDSYNEQVLIKALRANFKYQLLSLQEDLRKLNISIFKYFLISVTLLLLSFALKPDLEFNMLSTTLLEGVIIGGWVFLWQAISLFSFNRPELIEKLKEYNRLLNSKITFSYKSD